MAAGDTGARELVKELEWVLGVIPTWKHVEFLPNQLSSNTINPEKNSGFHRYHLDE